MLKWAVSKEGRGLATLSYSTSQGLGGEALVGTGVRVWPLCALTPDRAAWGAGGSAVKTTEVLSGCLRRLFFLTYSHLKFRTHKLATLKHFLQAIMSAPPHF